MKKLERCDIIYLLPLVPKRSQLVLAERLPNARSLYLYPFKYFPVTLLGNRLEGLVTHQLLSCMEKKAKILLWIVGP